MSATASHDPGRLAALAALVVASAESDHAANGIHHRHVAAADQVMNIARTFRDAGYALEMLTCTDRRFVEAGENAAPGAADGPASMRLSYNYNRFDPEAGSDRHLVVVDLPAEIPGAEAPSIVDLHPGANWYEREVFDMYGVRFAGHPDLKRILLPDDSDFHALLKDFGRIEDAPAEPGSDAEGEA